MLSPALRLIAPLPPEAVTFAFRVRSSAAVEPPAVLPQGSDACWCGSGRKYKRCHRPLEGKVQAGVISPMRPVPDHIVKPPYAATGSAPRWAEPRVKSPEIIERMRVASAMAAEVLRLAGEMVRPGITTDEIRTHDPGWAIFDGAVPGGEDIDQVAERAARVLARADGADGDVLLVSGWLGAGRGDVVVVEHPERAGFHIVKRVTEKVSYAEAIDKLEDKPKSGDIIRRK